MSEPSPPPPVVAEEFHGRNQLLSGKSTAEIPYLVSGAADEAAVATAAQNGTSTSLGAMIRRSIEIRERVNLDTWRVVVRYELPEKHEQENPTPTTAFDFTGGTQHITQSLETVETYGPAASEALGGAIGYDGENVAGVDITVPTAKWTETHYIDGEDIDFASYYALAGKVNSGAFRGCAAGEVLFLGATGQQRGDAKWEVTFHFAFSPNKTGLAVGSITGIAKKGWEYMWVQYGDDLDAVAKVRIKKPIAVYVEKVYEDGDFSSLGI